MSVGWKRKKYLDFPVEEYHNRLERFRKNMQQEGIEGAVVTQKENVSYFTGFRTDLLDSKYWTQGMGAVISLHHDPVLFTTYIDYGCAKTLCWMDNQNIRQWSPAGKSKGYDFDTGEGIILSILKELKLDIGIIGFEIGLGGRMTIPYDQFQRMLKTLPKMKIKDVSAAIMKTRMLKSEAEIERIRMACRVIDMGIDAVWKALDSRWRVGITQIELQQECAIAMAKAGGQMVCFSCWSGPPYMDTGNADPLPLKIKRGDIVNLDLVAKYKGYMADFMRIAFVGGKPKKEWGEMIRVLREAQMACIEKLKPGAHGNECWKACVDRIRKTRFFRDFIGTGHGLGLEFHELPRLPDPTTVFQKGMVTTVEPAIYPAYRLEGAPRAPGFWLEEVVVITAEGYEILSSYDTNSYIVL